MQPNFHDGLPVLCSTTYDAVHNQSRNCETQSTGGSADIPRSDSYYIPSPTSQLTEIGQQAQSQPSSSSFFPHPINTSVATYNHPQIHSASSSQGVWPTPPSTTCEGEDLDCYSYHGSPASGACGVKPIAPCSSNSSAPSPDGWSPRESQQQNYPPPLKESNHMPNHHFRHYPSLQYDQQLHVHMAYDDPNFPSANVDAATMAQQEVPTIVSGAAEPNPVAVHEHESPRQKEESPEGRKTDEPYAQLIWRAFLSTPTHSMTLQELYQWFRDHTDKAKDDEESKKGWMNSIRHNLSMNQAFARRDRKVKPSSSLTESGEMKTISEWVLEEWAVHGVQSTTRYRSKGTSTRRGGLGSRSRGRGSLSGRANSGRRGGVAASNSKRNAATRKAMMDRHNHTLAFPSSSNGNLHDPMQSIGYDHRIGLHYSHPAAQRSEPMGPPDPGHESMMLATNPMQATVLPATDASHGFPFAHNVPQYNQGNQQHVYSIDDVAGIYQSHQQAPVQMQGGQGLTQAMHTDLNALFEEPEESRNQRLAFSYWNDPAAGGPYHS
ncbi:hypothetical protein K449DRAFT_398848 [Hypoxylon sp. EC38]|nr:hypothetical protein K449DRAFT_398848 [Hypoxylon sp. EC38]